MRVSRDDFLHALERVQCGLSQGESVEQATCFVFKEGRVHAYNKKLYCSAPAESPIQGAVHAKPLLSSLRKLTVDEVELSEEDAHLVVKYGRKNRDRFAVRMEAMITLPIEDVDTPGEWFPLHESFSDALSLVQECAGKDREKMYVCTCIHVHPKWLEANDSVQATRYKINTGVTRACLIERDVLKHVVGSGVDDVGETDSWLHFRNGDFRMSCRRELDDYPTIGEFFKTKGEPITLPKSLSELAEQCEVFSQEDKDNNVLLVSIKPGKMRVHGQGVTGYARGERECEYEGPPIKFYLSPALLRGLAEKGSECLIGDGKLMIDGGKWRFVTAVGPVEEKETA